MPQPNSSEETQPEPTADGTHELDEEDSLEVKVTRIPPEDPDAVKARDGVRGEYIGSRAVSRYFAGPDGRSVGKRPTSINKEDS